MLWVRTCSTRVIGFLCWGRWQELSPVQSVLGLPSSRATMACHSACLHSNGTPVLIFRNRDLLRVLDPTALRKQKPFLSRGLTDQLP